MLKIERVVVAALAGAILSAAAAQDAVQWRVEDGGNGRWYQPVTIVDGTWNDARIMAETVGATLASVTSAEKTVMLNQLMLGWDWAFVGGIKVDGSWTWLNSDPWKYVNWVPGNPGGEENAIELRNLGDINDIDADTIYGSSYRAIIEWSADCNGDGIVDYGQILDGTFADEDGNGVPDLCDAVQWRVEDGGNGHWYQFVPEHTPWEVSRELALLAGADLACVTGELENNFIRNLIPLEDAGYLGGIRTQEGWAWVSGEAWRFTNWNPGEPNGSTIGEVVWLGHTSEAATNGWNDHTQAFDLQGYLIEWSADCNGDGIVDYGQILDGTYSDANGNGIPDCCDEGVACDCPADLNGDRMVGPPDLGILLALWNTDGSPNGADLNDDGIVTAADLGLLVGAWGGCN